MRTCRASCSIHVRHVSSIEREVCINLRRHEKTANGDTQCSRVSSVFTMLLY